MKKRVEKCEIKQRITNCSLKITTFPQGKRSKILPDDYEHIPKMKEHQDNDTVQHFDLEETFESK